LVPHQQLRHRRRRLLCGPVSVLERARADLGNAREADGQQQQQRLRQQPQDALGGQRQQQYNGSTSSSTGPLPGTLLSSAEHEGGITTAVSRSDGGSGDGSSTYYHVRVTGPPGARLVLHWGVDDWRLPPAGCIPPGSEQAGDRAVRTPFTSGAAASAAAAAIVDDGDGSDGDGEAAAEEAAVAAAVAPASVSLAFPAAECPERLVFVVHDVASDAWLRDHSADFSLPLRCVGWLFVSHVF
jgi:hypothetical protein